jgi:hypothetical protein
MFSDTTRIGTLLPGGRARKRKAREKAERKSLTESSEIPYNCDR